MKQINTVSTQTAKFMGPAWGPPGPVSPLLAPWTLLSRKVSYKTYLCLSRISFYTLPVQFVLCLSVLITVSHLQAPYDCCVLILNNSRMQRPSLGNQCMGLCSVQKCRWIIIGLLILENTFHNDCCMQFYMQLLQKIYKFTFDMCITLLLILNY